MRLFITRPSAAVYHEWVEPNDTRCRLWSTSGMNQDDPTWKVLDEAEAKASGKKLCKMCSIVYNKEQARNAGR
jgi:hypothetical protein